MKVAHAGLAANFDRARGRGAGGADLAGAGTGRAAGGQRRIDGAGACRRALPAWSARSATDRSPAARNRRRPNHRALCPSCGAWCDLEPADLRPGERLFVDRTAFLRSAPNRWGMVVCPLPEDPTTLCVKRVVGLPGERITLSDGDLYADGEIVRKDWDVLSAMAIVVDAGRLPARAPTPRHPAGGPIAKIAAGARTAEGFEIDQVASLGRFAPSRSTGSPTITNRSGGRGIASSAAAGRSSTTWLTIKTNRANWSPCPTSFSSAGWSRPAKARSVYGPTTGARSLWCGWIWPAGSGEVQRGAAGGGPVRSARFDRVWNSRVRSPWHWPIAGCS